MEVFRPDLKKISLDIWDHPIFQKNELRTDVLRLDKIHPEISGNKWFKLKYYLEKAEKTNKRKLISFGGPYSNHLLALAAAAKLYGFSSVGIIRGEKPSVRSPILVAAEAYGMEFQFLSRSQYDLKKKSAGSNELDSHESDALLIPEGGAGIDGIRGAEEILSFVPLKLYSHIFCAVGTGTTMAGLINASLSHQKKIGVSVLKGTGDFQPLNLSCINNQADLENIQIIHGGHFGGYAKHTKPLLDFMNRIHTESGIPTDFVYTGKLFYTVLQMVSEKAFPAGSRMLVLHTGGLHGNSSITQGLLQF